MRIICAWCKALMQDGPEHPVSHGMCQTCATAMHATIDAACPYCHRTDGQHHEGCLNDRPWAV